MTRAAIRSRTLTEESALVRRLAAETALDAGARARVTTRAAARSERDALRSHVEAA